MRRAPCIILANLDLFIVNVGLPNIAHDLNNHNLEDLSWILNGYAITYAALLVFFGRLAERYRRDVSFLVGVAKFTAASFALAVVSIALFVRHCLRSANPFVDPALFAIRQLTGASIAMAMFSAAFGAMLLSVVLWDQSVWGWTALKIGMAIAPGPLLVPTVSLLFSKRLIARFGTSSVVMAGVMSFALGLLIWAVGLTAEPSFAAVVFGMVWVGIGVGLTLPTLIRAKRPA